MRPKTMHPHPKTLRDGARPGATLLELVVTIAIGGMIFVILGAIMLAQGRFFAIEDALADTQVNAFAAADAVGRFAGSARAVVANRTVNGTAYSSGTTTVVLELPAVDNSDEVVVGAYDYVALGLDPSDPSRFIVDFEADPQSARESRTFSPASFVDKVIFRYNAVDITNADAVDLYVRTVQGVRGVDIEFPLGRIYFLGAS